MKGTWNKEQLDAYMRQAWTLIGQEVPHKNHLRELRKMAEVARGLADEVDRLREINGDYDQTPQYREEKEE